MITYKHYFCLTAVEFDILWTRNVSLYINLTEMIQSD